MNNYKKIFDAARIEVADNGFADSLMAKIVALPAPKQPTLEAFNIERPNKQKFIWQGIATTVACAIVTLIITSQITIYHTLLTNSAHNLLGNLINIP